MAVLDTDLFLVQRGATAHRTTAVGLKSYFSPSGGLTFQGAVDPTLPPPPGPYQPGFLYISNKPGVINNGWAGIGGQTATAGSFMIWDGTSWDLVTGATAGVELVIGTAPIQVDNTDPAKPVLSIADATVSAVGVVQLTTTAEAIAGTDASKALTAVAAKAAFVPLDISTLSPLP